MSYSLWAGSGRPSWSCSQTIWHIPLLCVQWKTPDDGQRNCPKHVDFYSKNKFQKLVHLVGFIMRIYHDTRSPERQVSNMCVTAQHSDPVSLHEHGKMNQSYVQYSVCYSTTFSVATFMRRRWDLRGWGTLLQAGISWVQFSLPPFGFFLIDLFLPAILWPWVRLNL